METTNGIVAIIERHDYSERKEIPVPEGQSLDFDEGTIYRCWLWPHLGDEWHLVEFRPASSKAARYTECAAFRVLEGNACA